MTSMQFCIVTALLGVLNMLANIPVQLAEVVNEVLREIKNTNTDIIEDSPDFARHCFIKIEQNESFSKCFSPNKTDIAAGLHFMGDVCSPEIAEAGLAAINSTGSLSNFLGFFLGFALCLAFSKIIQKRPWAFTWVLAIFAWISTIFTLCTYYKALYTNIPFETGAFHCLLLAIIPKGFDPILTMIAISRGLSGAACAFYGFFIDLCSVKLLGEGRTKARRIAKFGAMKVVSGSLAFVFPPAFIWMYKNLGRSVFMGLLAVVMHLPILLAGFLDRYLARQGQPCTTQEMIDEEEIELNEIHAERAKERADVQNRISKKERIYALARCMKKDFLLVLYPFMFFMTGINVLLYYKDIFIQYASSAPAIALTAAPLAGGLLMLVLPSKKDLTFCAMSGFLLIGICQNTLVMAKINWLPLSRSWNTTLALFLPALIVFLVNATLTPLLGVLPQHMGKTSPRIFSVYGAIVQAANFLAYLLLTTAYAHIGLRFLWVCVCFSIVSKIILWTKHTMNY
ncbi:uncharacterized protein NEMAJ01_0812 [Nematocida major]|uniref:uncharacterized protein n=1 Tax=Nematocida major TaxID=1912982 RepID=UPI0020078558|nr:uncharacterized protein NEMAJ01_0812 [Nematocida major]KAH9385916.1 hypothetical protein NEMAJ01_0812 [Nematocida major]